MKTWLACDEHVDFLREFLSTRDFPLRVSPLDATERDESELDETALARAERE